jgi:hypothetical protein
MMDVSHCGPTHVCGGACPCNCPPPAPLPRQCSSHSVRYATGEIVHYAQDLISSGFGTPWGHTRSFANRLSETTNVGNGYNWQVKEWPYLVILDDAIAVMGQATEVRWFILQDDGTYIGAFSVRDTLVADSSNSVYFLDHPTKAYFV